MARCWRWLLCGGALLLAAVPAPAAELSWQPRDLYIARHGQTEWNRVGRVQGDPDLGPKGYEDRIGLLLALRDAGLHVIYTSALQRTRRTAAPLAAHLQIEAKADPALNELESGIFEGICYSTLMAEETTPAHQVCRPDGLAPPAPAVAEYLRVERAKRQKDKVRYRPPGGESYQDGALRVGRFLDRNKRVLRAKTALIVAHAGTNRLLIAQLMGWPLEAVVRLRFENDWIYRVQAQPEGPARISLYRDGSWTRCAAVTDPHVGLDCAR